MLPEIMSNFTLSVQQSSGNEATFTTTVMTPIIRNSLLTLALLLCGMGLKAQVPTFAQDIAPIIYSKCTPCHNPNGVGNFMPLNDYQSVKRQGMNIMQATISKHMPPWPPDPTYSRHLRERNLTQFQINRIADWVNNQMPRGDSTLEPPAPTFTANNPTLGPPDTVIAFSRAHTKQAGPDEYRIFVFNLNLRQGRDIAAVEFVPGNPNIAHHAIVAMDTTGQGRVLDARDPGYGYPGTGGGFGFTPTELNWATWVPGSMPLVYPPGVGKRLFKNSDLLVQMHYGPTANAQKDSSYLRIYYARTPIRRDMRTILISPLNITNGPFLIPANTVRTFNARMIAPEDMSLIDVTPHAHLLCKYWESFAVHGPGDTTKLIRIPKYDFHWQGTYTYPRFVKIPRGTAIHARATYDNTVNNPTNPFRPPQNASWGEQTGNEMFLLGYSWVPYETGDEFISLDQQLVNLPAVSTKLRTLDVFPNPAREQVKLRFRLADKTPVSVKLFGADGREVALLLPRTELTAGDQDILLNLPNLASGVYSLQLEDVVGRISRRVAIY